MATLLAATECLHARLAPHVDFFEGDLLERLALHRAGRPYLFVEPGDLDAASLVLERRDDLAERVGRVHHRAAVGAGV